MEAKTTVNHTSWSFSVKSIVKYSPQSCKAVHPKKVWEAQQQYWLNSPITFRLVIS